MSKIMRVIVVLAIASAVAGQDRFSIQVVVKDSVADQLAEARSVIARLPQAQTDHDRRVVFATAIETLEAVPRVWPKERAAILYAAVLESDLHMASGAFKNAIDVLSRVDRTTAGNERGIAGVHLRMGRAYKGLRDYPKAEELLLKSEREAPSEGDETVLAATLDTAEVESTLGKSDEASRRYRQLSHARQVDDTSRASFAIRSARENLRTGKKGELKADLDVADNLLRTARGSATHSQDAMRIIQNLEREALALRNKL